MSLLLAGNLGAQGTSEPSMGDLKKMSLEELMNIEVVSVSRQPEKLLEAPSAIQVISNSDLRRFGSTTLPEALRLAGNLDVARKNSHDWGISARGFNTELSNKLLVMIDGRSVYTPLFSGVIWEAQDYLLEDVDRIEVVSGPGGSLWGANAVNGVINVISKSAKNTQGLFLQTGTGDLLETSAGARYGGTLAPGIYFRVYGKYLGRDSEVRPDGRSFSDSWWKSQGGFRIDSETNGRDTFTVQGDVYRGHAGLQAGGRDATSGSNVLARWSRTISPDSHVIVQAYYDRSHLMQPEPALIINGLKLAPAGTFEDDLDTVDLDVQHRFRMGARNRVVWGFGYRFASDHVTNAPSLGFLPAHLQSSLASGFAQDEIALRKDVALTIGTKLEHNDYTGLEVEPSVRLQWNRTPRQTVWSAVSRAVRAPSRIDRDLSEGVPPYFVLLAGGRNFASETVIAYEAGWRTRVSRKADASLSTFYNRYDDVRSTSTTPKTVFPFFFENNLEGHTYGVELSGAYQALDWWRLQSSYSWLKEQLHVKPGKTDLNKALNETSDPEHRFSLRSSMDLPGRSELDCALRWIDRRPGHSGATPGTLPGYVELDVRLGWNATNHLELAVAGQNLLHDHHPEYGFPTGVRAEIQRTFYANATWRY